MLYIVTFVSLYLCSLFIIDMEMRRPKVSVIMGLYNCAPYLQEALDSLYKQTFQDFEIILCEDGSSDNTYEIAQDYAKRHPNITLLRNNHNMGLNITLNNCLAVANGEYIARMDGDDISMPTRFQKEVDFLDNHPEFAIVSCPMIYFDENGEFGRGIAGGEPTKEAFINGTPFCHAPCMVRKEAYTKVNGYTVSKNLLRVEDYHLWMKMFAEGYRGYNLDEHLYLMRDDRNAARRRNWIGRRNSAYAMWLAFRTLHLPITKYPYCLLPIIKYFIPTYLYQYFHKRKLNQK